MKTMSETKNKLNRINDRRHSKKRSMNLKIQQHNFSKIKQRKSILMKSCGTSCGIIGY